MESFHDELRMSKIQKTFGDDFYTYLIENESSSYFETIYSSNALLRKEVIKIELEYILKNQT